VILWIGITDEDWFRFLCRRPELDEVNFWQPSGKPPIHLAQGAPFLFKLHSPKNYIVGGGFFAAWSVLPASLVWETFEQQNGAATFEEMAERIRKYRPQSADELDPQVGCNVIVQPFFLDEVDWIPVPPSFSLHSQRGKSYDTSTGEGAQLWERVQSLLRVLEPSSVAEERAPMFGEPTLIRPRLGQGSFRVLITDTYHRRCAITGERALPVLEAAHIRPVNTGGQHRIDNGLLLRSDLHRLFDRGYVTVTPDYRIEVSRRLKDEFENGEPYYPYAGKTIWLPEGSDLRPRQEFLEWHADTVFRG